MKEVIERLKTLEFKAKQYGYLETSTVGVSVYDIRTVLDFYEQTVKASGLTEDEFNIGFGIIEDNPLSRSQYTKPNWSEIPKGFDWIAIDGTGGEYAYQSEPYPINHVNLWNSRFSSVFTGRKFDMSNINWKDSLLKRPKQEEIALTAPLYESPLKERNKRIYGTISGPQCICCYSPMSSQGKTVHMNTNWEAVHYSVTEDNCQELTGHESQGCFDIGSCCAKKMPPGFVL